MNRVLCIFGVLFLGFSLKAEAVWDGIRYDDQAVANLVTVIISTSPIASHPDTRFIQAAMGSLCRIPTLKLCKKIIVFDGIKEKDRDALTEKYALYKQKMVALTQSDPNFINTELVFCPSWSHLSGAIRIAMQQVTTPFVWMHQHDLVLKKRVDVNRVIASMVANPQIKYVHFSEGVNSDWTIDQEMEGQSFLPLCRFFGWTDQTHIARKDYYDQFILPNCISPTFMESIMGEMFTDEILQLGPSVHSRYGTYLYGPPSDGRYILHLDGRHS